MDLPGALLYVSLRGIERKTLFQDDADRDDFLDRLARLLKETSTSCYAWALAPNQVHLLVRTQNTPIASVMLRLLTGYVASFNRRYGRRGPLFQSRYKSTLCQEDPYLLELVRYIHLIPLRVGVVRNLSELANYRYAGHSVIVGRRKNDWQEVHDVLRLCGAGKPKAREAYSAYVKLGMREVREIELARGGAIRSAGGFSEFKRFRKKETPVQGDDQILGDGTFVEQVLINSEKRSQKKLGLRPKGLDLDRLGKRVSFLFRVKAKDLYSRRKNPESVKARSVFCYWAVKELGESATSLARRLGISQPGVSISAQRGERIVREMNLSLSQK